MEFLIKINNGLARVEQVVLSVALLTMIVFAFLQVILRNFFNTGLLWSDVFVRHLVLWVGFLGASLATKERNHIRVDLLSRYVPLRLHRPFFILLDLFAGVVCTLLFLAAFDFLRGEMENGGRLFLKVPAWVMQLIIPLVFLMAGLRFFINLLLDLFEKKPVETPPVTFST
ncbi:MAG: TRAP transporter small permease [Deltaproteobacteria bacterium]|nr:TRAP transporter small permease [Deltaproteobacteria bacterium]